MASLPSSSFSSSWVYTLSGTPLPWRQKSPLCMVGGQGYTVGCSCFRPRDTRIALEKHEDQKLGFLHQNCFASISGGRDDLFTCTHLGKDGLTVSVSLNGSESSGIESELSSRPSDSRQPLMLGETNPTAKRNEPLITIASLLKRYGKAKALPDARRMHAYLNKYGYDKKTFIGNCIVEMYGNCGRVEDARSAFDTINHVNLYSWNILINAYAKNGHSKEALLLFRQMQLHGFKPDPYTFVCALNACATATVLKQGQDIHASIVDSGYLQELVVINALVSTYGKCGSLCDSRSVFGGMARRDLISWNAVIAACTQNGHGKEALDYFYQMQVNGFKPDSVTFVCALDACTCLPALEVGQEIHATLVSSGFEGEISVATALINMYGQCRCLGDARSVFSQMPERNVVSWNSMIAMCAENGDGWGAMEYFHEMQNDGFNPNHVTFASALDACACLASLEEGQKIHATIVDSGYEGEAFVGTALLNMYGKCGCVPDARSVFGGINQRDVISWNAMIAACAQNGYDKEALKFFHQMQADSIKPDRVTFLSVLTACSHTGRIDDGRHYFFSISQIYGLTYTLEHYVCMVDLLGRAGHLEDAEDLISNISPCEKSSTIWLRFLAGCRIHANVERGVHAANSVFHLDPNNSAPFIMLSNIYAAADMEDNAQYVL